MRPLLAVILVFFASCHQPERMAGISDRKWSAQGVGWKMDYRAKMGAEIEGSLDIIVSSNSLQVILEITRSSVIESHRIRAAIEQKLAEKGLTLDSAVVAEIADAAVAAVEHSAEAAVGVAEQSTNATRRGP